MLVAETVSLTRGSRRILSAVSLSLNEGEFVVVLGPSGSGKSTLMKAMAGIISADKGRVILDGRALSAIDQEERCRAIGVVPQDDIIHPQLKVEDALRYAARLRFPHGSPAEEVEGRVEAVLAMLELSERRKVRIKRLSGGQRKRVSMGVELLRSPRFLFLDEPTSGLDPALEETMMALFRSLARQGHGIIASTHAMASIDLADQVLIIMAGELIFLGPPSRALAHFSVRHPSEIFKVIRGAEAGHWRARFASSPLAAMAVAPRVPGPTRRAGSHKLEPTQAPPRPRPPESAESILKSLEAELENEGGTA